MMRRALLNATVGLVLLITTASSTSSMNAFTFVALDCYASEMMGDTWWSFEVDARTIPPSGSGPIYFTGVYTDWAAVCVGWGCEDEGYDDDESYSGGTAKVYHANNGYVSGIHDRVYGSAYSSHSVEGEYVSDSDETSDHGMSPPCVEMRS